MKKPLHAVLCVLFMLAATLPANAASYTRVVNWQYQNPSSQLENLKARYDRLGSGRFMLTAMGSSCGSGCFVGAAIQSAGAGSLYAQVAATSTTPGALYQVVPDDPFAVGGTPGSGGTSALPADTTPIMVQSPITSPPIAVGPLPGASTAGQSIAYTIECQIVTQYLNPISFLFYTAAAGNYTATASRDLADPTTCQFKASAAAVSPIVPPVDAGWVNFGSVIVPNGATTIANGYITQAAPFYGFAQATVTGGITEAQLPHGAYVDLPNAQTIAGGKTFAALIVAQNGVTVSAGNVSVAGGAFYAGASPYNASTLPGDASFSESPTCGKIWLGGSTAAYPIDGGCTHAGVTIGGANVWTGQLNANGVNVGGALSGATTGTFSGDITTAGNIRLPTTGWSLFSGATSIMGADGTSTFIRPPSSTGSTTFQNMAQTTNYATIDGLGIHSSANVSGPWGTMLYSAGNSSFVFTPGSGATNGVYFTNIANSVYTMQWDNLGNALAHGTFGAGGGISPGTPASGGAPGAAAVYSGTGIPTFSAANGSTYMRYDGAAGTREYVNTSGPNTIGSAWTAYGP